MTPDIEEALALVAEEYGLSRDEALELVARDWLIGHGYLPFHEEEEGTELTEQSRP